MDAQQYLIELGYTAEEATTQLSDARFKKSIDTAVQKYEEGIKAKADAEKSTAELNTWWKETAQPSLLNADGGSAAAKAEAARYKTYIASMKEQGYPVPDDWTKDGVVTPPAAKNDAFDPRKFQEDFSNDTAKAMAKIYDLGAEYQELHGSPLPNAYGLLEEARSQNKPLTDYVRTKFNFDGKRAEIAEKKISDRIAVAVKEAEDRANAKAAERSNPNLAPAVISRAVQVAEANKEHADSWKTKVGRNEAKRDRLLSFRNVDTKIA